MQREGFSRLSVSQKIHKLASLARESIHHPEKENLFWECCTWIGEDPHPRLQRAFRLIQERSPLLASEKTTWFHLYHDLLQLNSTEINEEDYLPAVFDRESPLQRWKAAVMLCDIRSPFNVGSIIRTAEAFGWHEVVLSGITPTPAHPRVRKTSMDAHEWISLSTYSTPEEALTIYRKQNYHIIALETDENAIPIWEYPWQEQTLLIVGNEEFGIPQSILTKTETIVTIPLYGRKRSLNVANAFSIVAAVASHQWLTHPTSGKN